MSYSVSEALQDLQKDKTALQAIAQYDRFACNRDGRWYSDKLTLAECDDVVVFEYQVRLCKRFGDFVLLPSNDWMAPVLDVLLCRLREDPDALAAMIRWLKGRA